MVFNESIGRLQEILSSNQMKYHSKRSVAESYSEAFSQSGHVNGSAPRMVMTLPQLVVAKTMFPDCDAWRTSVDSSSVACRFPDSEGRYVKKGNFVLMTLHGVKVFDPEKLAEFTKFLQLDEEERIIYENTFFKKGHPFFITRNSAIPLDGIDYASLLRGIAPDGQKFSVYSIDEMISGCRIDLLEPHAIVQPLENELKTKTGYYDGIVFGKFIDRRGSEIPIKRNNGKISGDFGRVVVYTEPNLVQASMLSSAIGFSDEYFDLAKNNEGEVLYCKPEFLDDFLSAVPHANILRLDPHQSGVAQKGLFGNGNFSTIPYAK